MAQSRDEAGADLTVTGSTALSPWRGTSSTESFDSSLASPALGALNETQEMCRTKGFSSFLRGCSICLAGPTCVIPLR